MEKIESFSMSTWVYCDISHPVFLVTSVEVEEDQM